MPVRYRRLSARFARAPFGLEPLANDPYWAVSLLPAAPATWRPAIDVCESPASLVVVLDVAGLDEERTEITLFGDTLVVEGERSLEPCPREGRYQRAEIRQGPFRAEVALPFAVDPDGLTATYERGLLRVELPRTPPRRLGRTR